MSLEKQSRILRAGDLINENFKSAIPVLTEDGVNALWRTVIRPQVLKLLDLARLCETETIRDMASGAHFSSCLMGAAMNEALLAVMCLLYEDEVRKTDQFHYSTRKLGEVVYEDVVSNWKLAQFARVSKECNWIPSEKVDNDTVINLAVRLRSLDPNPSVEELDPEEEMRAFKDAPGPGMLEKAQELRNSIHPGKWMRREGVFDEGAVLEWCRFATALSCEIRLCLMDCILVKMTAIAKEQADKVRDLLESYPPEAIEIWAALVAKEIGVSSFGPKELVQVISILGKSYPPAS